jgi:hypothetical protein
MTRKPISLRLVPIASASAYVVFTLVLRSVARRSVFRSARSVPTLPGPVPVGIGGRDQPIATGLGTTWTCPLEGTMVHKRGQGLHARRHAPSTSGSEDIWSANPRQVTAVLGFVDETRGDIARQHDAATPGMLSFHPATATLGPACCRRGSLFFGPVRPEHWGREGPTADWRTTGTAKPI